MAPPGLHRERKATKILYIEDNPENRMLARAILEAEGYTVVDAEDGLAGIERAVSEKPALILLDVNLPGVDGYEVVAILKSFPTLATTPVIAVTAYAMEGDRQRTLVAGCDGYIQKPIDVDRFPRQVEEFLRGKRERVDEVEAGPYLRELNQRLVYRLISQVEELKRLNQHFVRRAVQLEDLHEAVQDITAEIGLAPMLERLLRAVARALGTVSLTVELADPAGMRVTAEGTPFERTAGVLGATVADEWVEVEWTLPLTVRGRGLGTLTARHVVPPGARSDEEQLLKIVAKQLAIAVENTRLYTETQARLRQTETLLGVSQAVGSALTIAEAARRYLEHPPVKELIDIPRMAVIAQAMLRDALDAWVRRDTALAQSVLDRDDELDGLKPQVFRELLTYMLQNQTTIEPSLDLILISRHLERIGDHATNVAEDVIFMVSARDVRHHATH